MQTDIAGGPGWPRVLGRVWSQFSSDRILAVAAGVTFYILLALVPSLVAFVSLYGLFSDPAQIAQHVELIRGVVPDEGVEIIATQLRDITSAGGASLTLASIISLVIALWSANGATKAIIDALNVAYNATEERSFIRLTLLSLLLTVGGIALGLVMIAAVAVLPAVLAFLPLGGVADALIRLVRWPLLLGALLAVLAVLYYVGPCRPVARWRWITPGALVAAAGLILFSMLFSWYAANFGNYNETYGSLGAIIGFLIWAWLSVTIVLVGAELNAEIEAAETGREPA